MLVSKKKIKAFVLSGAIATSLIGVATEGSAETLGWSEDGNLTENSVNSTFVTSSSSEPDYHNGWSEYYDEHTERAVGETGWDGVYHYTRARMETLTGTVKTDSGRIYGNDYTMAKSPYAGSEYSARTYWGTES